MRRRLILLLACAVLVVNMAAWPALAGGAVTRQGSCSGRGEWWLRVRQETSTTIRVRFVIDRLEPGDTWQVFLSDNGTRILSASRVVDEQGEIRAVKITTDRPGTDRVKGTGVNISGSGSCEGVVAY